MKKLLTLKLWLLTGSLVFCYGLSPKINAHHAPVWYSGAIYLLTGEVLEGQITFQEEQTRLKDVVFLRTKNNEGTYQTRGYYFKELQKMTYYDTEWQLTRTLARYEDRFYEKLVSNSDDLHLLVIPHKHLGDMFEGYSYLSYFFWYDGKVEYIQNFPRQFRKICEDHRIDYCEFIKNTHLSPTDPKQQELLIFYFNKWRKSTNLIVKN
ncbi:MAG: hypothetical protein NW226_13745 [Microscillaceae bacterium]|nr:hypothetical protein [Microscillaceae bacterium]